MISEMYDSDALYRSEADGSSTFCLSGSEMRGDREKKSRLLQPSEAT